MTTGGPLAIAENQSLIYTLGSPVSAGSNVQLSIGVAFGINTLAGERYYIADPSSGLCETFLTNATAAVTYVEAVALVNAYTTAAKFFRAALVVPGAFMQSGFEFPGGDTEAAGMVAKDIAVTFVSVDAPVYGVIP